MKTIKIEKDKVQVMISVFTFLDRSHPDKDVWIAYCPELDLTGYGHGEDEAKSSLGVVLNDYIRYATENGTLKEDLLSHGWKMDGEKPSSIPTYNYMLTQGYLDNVVNAERYSKDSIPFEV